MISFNFVSINQKASLGQAKKVNIYLLLSEMCIFSFNFMLNATGFGFANLFSAGFSYILLCLITLSILFFAITLLFNNYYRIYNVVPLLLFYLGYLSFSVINLFIQVKFFPVNETGLRPVNPLVLLSIFVLNLLLFAVFDVKSRGKAFKYLKSVIKRDTLIDYELSFFVLTTLENDDKKDIAIDSLSLLNKAPFLIGFSIFVFSWNNDWIVPLNFIFFVGIGLYIAISIGFLIINLRHNLIKSKYLLIYVAVSLIMELIWLSIFYMTNNINSTDVGSMKFGPWFIEFLLYYAIYGVIFSVGNSALSKAKLFNKISSEE